MPITTPMELFVHELEDTYDAEHRILKMLKSLPKEIQDQEVLEGIEEHQEETQQHIKNLEKCFEQLGKKAKGTPCMGAQGLQEEHDAFVKEEPSPPVLQLFNLGGMLKTEHYEICSYSDLIESAELMGETEVVKLLKENLKQEEAMAKKVETLSKRISKATIKEAVTA